MFSARIAIRLPASFMLPPCRGYTTSSDTVTTTRVYLARRPGCSTTLGVSLGSDAGGQPARRAQQPRIAVARADELNAERQAVRTLHERHAEGGHAGERPQRAVGGIARRVEPRRRGAGGGGRQDGVIALGEQLGEALREGRDAGQRAKIVDRRHLSAPLEPRAQRGGQPGAPRLPLPAEIRRRLRFHDDAVPLERLAGRSSELELLRALAEVSGELGEGLA